MCWARQKERGEISRLPTPAKAGSLQAVDAEVRRPTAPAPDKDSIYWLDYASLSKGGKLSLELDASFDARDFQPNLAPGGGTSGVQAYYVPDGCVGCHGGENFSRPLINYLDMDHWFDRLDNDFARVRAEAGK